VENLPAGNDGWTSIFGILGLLRKRFLHRLPRAYRTLGDLTLLAIEKLGPVVLTRYDRRRLAKLGGEVRLGWAKLMAQLDTDEGRRCYADLGDL
jgi:hypothetical protein